jgi:hypothetical protein
VNFHLPAGKDIRDKFIDNVIAVLTSGVKKMMADDFD